MPMTLVMFCKHVFEKGTFLHNNNSTDLPSLKFSFTMYDSLTSYYFSVKVLTLHHYSSTDNFINKIRSFDLIDILDI